MKKIILASYFLLVALKFSFAQQQWKFHIAFEDGIGAKDTIWFIYDTSATSTCCVDTFLGEGPFPFDYNAFNVWIYNYHGDSTKVFALPYVYYPSHGTEVRAFNYQYPLTVTWDTALLHASYLPTIQGVFNIGRIDNDYFFLVNNDPPLQAFNLLLSDNAFAPYFTFGSQDQFPMQFTLSKTTTIGIDKAETSNAFIVYPNPFNNAINLENNFSSSEKYTIEVFSLDGKSMFKKQSIELQNVHSIDLSFLERGIYYLQLINKQNTHYEKIFKI